MVDSFRVFQLVSTSFSFTLINNAIYINAGRVVPNYVENKNFRHDCGSHSVARYILNLN